MSQVFLFLIFFCVFSIDAATIRWSGYTDGNWWNEMNWNCDRDDCLPTPQDDVVFDPNGCTFCVRHITLGISQANIRSLVIQSTSDFQFTLDILSGIGLVVGSGGVTIDKLSTLYVYGKLYSTGNVKSDGNFLLQSGEIYGPGGYTLNHLVASSCFLYANVTVTTDLNVEPQAPGLADTILIQPNGSLTVYGNLITDNPITISGKIAVNNSVTFLSRNESFRYVLSGNSQQVFGSIHVPTGLLISTTPIVTQNLFVGAGANVQINYDSTIGNATGSGLVNIQSGNVKLEVTDSKLQIISTANLVIMGNNVGMVTINGGVLTTDLKGGNLFNVNNLTIVRGYLNLSPMTVAKWLFLGDGVIVYQGSLNVTGKAVSIGTLTIMASVIVIEKGATFEQLNGNFQLVGDTDNTGPVFVNEGLYSVKGYLHTSVFMGGSGVWNIDGTWLVAFPCKITGTINLIGNSTITFENMYYSYNLGTVQDGGLFGNVGYFTAKELSVNWINEQFSQLTVDNITTETSYISRCCGQKKIGILNTDLLDLETGDYTFNVGKGLINNVKLMDGVNLEFDVTADITNFQFIGGSLQSDNGVTITVRNTTYLTSNSQKVIYGAKLETAILDCTGCQNPTCNLSGWGNIKAATTRGRCANQAEIFG